MRLSRTDLVPGLAIIGGAAFGVLTFGSFLLLWSPSDDVPAPDPVVVHFVTSDDVPAPDPVVAHFVTVEAPTGVVFAGDRVQYDPVGTSLPDGRWVVSPSDGVGEPRLYLRTVDGSVTPRNAALRTRP